MQAAVLLDERRRLAQNYLGERRLARLRRQRRVQPFRWRRAGGGAEAPRRSFRAHARCRQGRCRARSPPRSQASESHIRAASSTWLSAMALRRHISCPLRAKLVRQAYFLLGPSQPSVGTICPTCRSPVRPSIRWSSKRSHEVEPQTSTSFCMFSEIKSGNDTAVACAGSIASAKDLTLLSTAFAYSGYARDICSARSAVR